MLDEDYPPGSDYGPLIRRLDWVFVELKSADTTRETAEKAGDFKLRDETVERIERLRLEGLKLHERIARAAGTPT